MTFDICSVCVYILVAVVAILLYLGCCTVHIAIFGESMKYDNLRILVFRKFALLNL